MKTLSIFTLIVVTFINMTEAVEVAPRISDREIIETLTALKEGQKSILREMDKRFENINRRLDQLVNIFIGIVAAFTGVVAVTIGFAIWDRKTAVAPIARRLKKVESENERIKKALKDIAEKNPDFAEVLKHTGLL